jgi:hypothetical protein
MSEEIFKGRERGFEAEWANRSDAELIEKLREKGRLEAITEALAKQLQADDPVLLQRTIDLGVTLDTGPAFLLAPLVQVAWAEGNVSQQESDAVMRLATGRGIAEDTPAHAQLLEWLRKRPKDELFDTAIEVIKAGFSVLSPTEREERVAVLLKACQQVAEASGGGLWRALGRSGVSGDEATFLDHIKSQLRG